MKLDILSGAILPPIVLGIVVDRGTFDAIDRDTTHVNAILPKLLADESISLIDGIQRTTALYEVAIEHSDINNAIRIELWISLTLNNLIYRMLILNTAQIPWTVKRQLEVFYSALSKQIRAQIPNITIYQEDDRSRRSQSAEYQENHIIELYLCFSTRKLKIDTREALSEEFARLDAIESTSSPEFTDMFISTLKDMVNFDITISATKLPNVESEGLSKFKSGFDIFSSQPARAGFITAASFYIYGRPGTHHDKPTIQMRIQKLHTGILTLLDTFQSLTDDEKSSFLALPTLDERLNVKTTKVGDLEREFFYEAFSTLLNMIEKAENITNFEPLWRSY